MDLGALIGIAAVLIAGATFVWSRLDRRDTATRQDKEGLEMRLTAEEERRRNVERDCKDRIGELERKVADLTSDLQAEKAENLTLMRKLLGRDGA